MGNQESTEQERAEFINWHMDVCRASEISSAHVWDNHHLVALAWQAARRAPVVQPDQLPPDAAKRAMEALQTEVEALRRALAECRDAFPVPAPGSPIEPAWMQAMGHAEAVPDYMRAIAAAPVELPEPDAYANPLAFEQFKQGRGGVHGREWMFAAPHPELVGIYTADQVRLLLQAKTTATAGGTSASSS